MLPVIVLADFLLRNELSIHVEIENVIKHLCFALGGGGNPFLLNFNMLQIGLLAM